MDRKKASAKKGRDVERDKKIKEALEELDDPFGFSAVSELEEYQPELDRLAGELHALRCRENSSREVVILRWESPMSRLDFLDLVADLKTTICELRELIGWTAREEAEKRWRLEKIGEAGTKSDKEAR